MKVKPKKALGQHFLTDLDIARRIAQTIGVEPYSGLPAVEIGPGMGVLTQYLMEQPRPLMAVEIDGESVDYLHRAYPQLNVVEADFLRMAPEELPTGEFALIGNYPYNISSQIFFRVLELRDRIPIVTGMLQREVAQRICAPEGSKTRGILSVLLQVWYDCEYLFTVNEGVFNPPPKVKSGVIRLRRNGVTDPGCDWDLLRRVVKTAFGQRRKTLRNSLSPLLPKAPAQQPQDSALQAKECTLQPQMSALLADPIMSERPERLTVAQFIHLTNRIAETTRPAAQSPREK